MAQFRAVQKILVWVSVLRQRRMYGYVQGGQKMCTMLFMAMSKIVHNVMYVHTCLCMHTCTQKYTGTLDVLPYTILETASARLQLAQGRSLRARPTARPMARPPGWRGVMRGPHCGFVVGSRHEARRGVAWRVERDGAVASASTPPAWPTTRLSSPRRSTFYFLFSPFPSLSPLFCFIFRPSFSLSLPFLPAPRTEAPHLRACVDVCLALCRNEAASPAPPRPAAGCVPRP